MDINKYIYDYLKEYNASIIVPELGCFYIVNNPAEIKDGVVIPPVKTVRLDSENTVDELQVFTVYVARKENIPLKQAEEGIREFYQRYFIKKLPAVKSLTFENFGIFSLDDWGNIIFEPVADFFSDHYGLGSVQIPDGEIQEATTPSTEPELAPFAAPDPDQNEQIENPFDSTDNTTRFRETQTRTRRPAYEPQEPPVQPANKKKTRPSTRKPKEKTKTGDSNLWILWVLLGAAALGVAGYYFYPQIHQALFTPTTTFITIDEKTPTSDSINIAETEEPAVNDELAQTLDNATDKKTALNPSANKPSDTSTVPAATAPSAKQAGMASFKGNYVLVVSSHTTQAAAEKFAKKLQAAGIEWEIIDAGRQRFRVVIAGCETLDEAVQLSTQMKSKPHCAGVWVIRR